MSGFVLTSRFPIWKRTEETPGDSLEDKIKTRKNMSDSLGAHERNTSPQSYARGFLKWEVMRYAAVLLIVGIGAGYPAGMSGVWLVLQEYSEDCGMYTSAAACRNVRNQHCLWNSQYNTCEWEHGMCSNAISEPLKCNGNDKVRCHYSSTIRKCVNSSGYPPFYSGIFGCSPMIMQIVVGLFAGDILSTLHHRRTFMLAGSVFVVGSVFQHGGVSVNSFWVSILGRILLGLSNVLMTVPGMVYVNQCAPDKYKQSLVSFYCVALNLGQFIPAALGGFLGLSIDFSSSTDPVNFRFQLFIASCTLTGIVFVLMGYLIRESPYWHESPCEYAYEKEGRRNTMNYSWSAMAKPLAIGVCAAGVVQLTGMSAFCNYAPSIARGLGINGLVGNLLLQGWNVLSASLSIGILGVTTNLRKVMLTGTAISSLACLVVGAAISPGFIANDQTRNMVVLAGIAVYIMSFQSCVAGAFFPLTQEMFPPPFRPRGSSVMTMSTIFFAFAVSVSFPTALQHFSGGSGGNPNPNQGMSSLMLIFSSVGMVGFVMMLFFLRPWAEGHKGAIKGKAV